MAQVELHTPAPNFELEDFNGYSVRRSDFEGDRHLVLVFNRGFL